MQGWESFIPTTTKVEYINQLLKVGFDTIDVGSFVSPRAIPQMRDTAEVLAAIELSDTSSRLLTIVANLRGAEEACKHPLVNYIGFPLSLSETFQQRNNNKSIAEALNDLLEIQSLCIKNGKTLVVYLSMGFGNPYGDPYEPALVAQFVDKLNDIQVSIVSLSDTIGISSPANITSLFTEVIPAFPHIEFGAHLHSDRDTALNKVEAAYHAGCQRIDGAIKGFGGCPMAEDELVGNMPTEIILQFCNQRGISTNLDTNQFDKCLSLASGVFVGATAH